MNLLDSELCRGEVRGRPSVGISDGTFEEIGVELHDTELLNGAVGGVISYFLDLYLVH